MTGPKVAARWPSGPFLPAFWPPRAAQLAPFLPSLPLAGSGPPWLAGVSGGACVRSSRLLAFCGKALELAGGANKRQEAAK